MKCYKNIIVIICFFVFACVKVAWADSYTITFKASGYYNPSEVPTTSTPCSDLVTAGGDYLSGNLIRATNVFNNDEFGLRLGTSSSAGEIKMNLSLLGQVNATSIVVRAKRYNSSKAATLSLNGSDAQSVLADFTDLTYNISGQIDYLQLNSSKYVYIQSITVSYIAGVPHTLTTAVSPTGSGTVSPSSATVSEGSTATITATPNSGYAFDHWTVSGAGSSLSSTTTNPTTFTMGTANATVTAYFTALPAYRVTFNASTGTCATPYLDEASGGAGVVLPSATAPTGCDPEYHFYGWATSLVGETSTPPAIVGAAGDTYHPAANTTLFAVYVAGGYQKVTSAPSDWSGTYLIVYEDGSKAFNGSLATLDAANNNISVTIAANIIASNPTTDASSFVIAKSGENYTIKSSSGYYIGRTTNSNGLDATSTGTAYTNTISYNDGNVDILSSGGAYLRFNNGGSEQRFRFFKSSSYTGQQAIQLYRRIGASSFSSNPSCSCPSPSNFAASSITSSTAYLSWTAGGSETQWQVVVSNTELVDAFVRYAMR